VQGDRAQGPEPHLVTKEHVVQPPSPYTALGMLLMFKQRRIDLDEETYDVCVDVLVGVLEDVNDEKFRLQPRRVIALG